MLNKYKQCIPSLQKTPSEQQMIAEFLQQNILTATDNEKILNEAVSYVDNIRKQKAFPLMERLMHVYSLSSAEGKALMELAEALLRTPSEKIKQALLSDKLPNKQWLITGSYLHVISGSLLHIASSIANPDNHQVLSNMVQRLGMPLVSRCMQAFMKAIASQFIYAEDIHTALRKANKAKSLVSFDMLGEGARDEAKAQTYFANYKEAIIAVGEAKATTLEDSYHTHGISIKLSALYARYELRQYADVMQYLYARIFELCMLAKSYQINITLDAEEDARLDLSLQIMTQLISSELTENWDGLGLAVQAYQRRGKYVLSTIYELLQKYNRKIHIRLVKGAYWDYEIKVAQQKGLHYFPCFTQKRHTDIAYLTLAQQLLKMTDYIYPMFATHNAQTLCSIKYMANIQRVTRYELQHLHGLGKNLMEQALAQGQQPIRTYAPIGDRNYLFGYLIRRLLENGANSSFISQIHDSSISSAELCANPVDYQAPKKKSLKTASQIFMNRQNSKGYDLADAKTLNVLGRGLQAFSQYQWLFDKQTTPLHNSAKLEEIVGYYQKDTTDTIKKKIAQINHLHTDWQNPSYRIQCLRQIAQLFEEHDLELMALLQREAGKSIIDATAEVREAVDFCRYYASQVESMTSSELQARGKVLCIAPWNFPLAIFTGQIVAALVTGNAVIAKPAEQTPLIAQRTIKFMYQAGVPQSVLALIHIGGEAISAHIIKKALVDMVVFTGSTETARRIQQNIAFSKRADIPLVAETGGINAMLIDGSALIERAIDDIIISAFQSAGQRCSALRLLLVHTSIAERVIRLLIGRAKLEKIGNPANFNIDIGPIISQEAKQNILHYLEQNQENILWQAKLSEEQKKGNFVPLTIIQLQSIQQVTQEVFAPVLHLISYDENPTELIKSVNKLGYGLTFAMHGRLNKQQRDLAKLSEVGNIYINRDQIGATVESQPFGGLGLSGTGPKAGGPLYLRIFYANYPAQLPQEQQHMPSVDGENNEYQVHARGEILCINQSAQHNHAWLEYAKQSGNQLSIYSDSGIDILMKKLDYPTTIKAILIIPIRENSIDRKLIYKLRQKIAEQLPIIPIVHDSGALCMLHHEKHICTNTTASGGNLDLLSTY